METLTIHLPTMYGDHHVLEVRRVLLEMPGVEEVYASSCFQIVEIHYDPAKVGADALRSRLEEAGYLQGLAVPVETGKAAYGRDEPDTFFRHTTAYEQTRQVVSFAQNVGLARGSLWPCPGLGVISSDIDKANGDG